MTRPLGPRKVSVLVGVAGHGPSSAVHQMMVMQTEKREVFKVGPAARLPGHDVVGVGEGDVGAAREAAVAVPAHDLSALGVGRLSPGPALVHGVPDVVVDTDGDGGVAGDLADGLGVDQAVALEVPGQLAGLAFLVEEGG